MVFASALIHQNFNGRSANLVKAPPNMPPLVVCPGFGNATRDYIAPFGDANASLVAALARRGFHSHVVQVDRKDWFRVGRMAFTMEFYRRQCTTDPGYSWFLERVQATVAEARAAHNADKVVLVGHSAGGWLARAFLGQQEYKDEPLSSGEDEPHNAVAALVTLGTPHSPPPLGSGVSDMTGGALSWVDTRWPGAYFAESGIKYICVGSRAVTGDIDADARSLPGYSAGSYKQVAGVGHGVEGDGVVPLASALLEGGVHIVLDDVLHSMSRIRTFESPAEEPWYGSCEVVDSWLAPLVRELLDPGYAH